MKATILLATLLGLTAYSQSTNPPGIEWQAAFGGSGWDSLQCLLQTADGDLVAGGYSASGADGNKTSPSSGSSDYWLVKLEREFITLSGAPQNPSDILQNGFRFSLKATPNHNYVSEYSTDGLTWVSWQTNQLAGAETEIIDRSASNAPMRLYRVSRIKN